MIYVYDEYLLTMMKTNRPDMYEHIQTRLFTNMTGVPFHSQSHDARHAESNKKGKESVFWTFITRVKLSIYNG